MNKFEINHTYTDGHNYIVYKVKARTKNFVVVDKIRRHGTERAAVIDTKRIKLQVWPENKEVFIDGDRTILSNMEV